MTWQVKAYRGSNQIHVAVVANQQPVHNREHAPDTGRTKIKNKKTHKCFISTIKTQGGKVVGRSILTP